MQEERTGGVGVSLNHRDLGQVRVFLLRALDRCNGQPMPGTTLVDTVVLAFPHLRGGAATYAEASVADLATRGMIGSIEREIDGTRLWVLTEKGRGLLAGMPPR